MKRAATEAGFSLEKAKLMERDKKKGILERGPGGSSISQYVQAKANSTPDWAVNPEAWKGDAQEALADLSGQLFCKRYVGMELSPWQQYMWRQLEEAWVSDEREFLCVNAPPGLGKSTVLVAYAAKLTVLHREIRGLFMSRSFSLAERNTLRLRRLLERSTPFTDAYSSLSLDFGKFRPNRGELWRAFEFVVEQLDGTPIEEKEPTWAAFGFDAEWLGNRLDVLFGDDLDSSRNLANMDTVTRNRKVFDDELEPRVDKARIKTPSGKVGGLMCVAQQRLGAWDFSGHVLSKMVVPDDDGVTEVEGEHQYRQVIFKAHYDNLCRGDDTHKVRGGVLPPAWPDGCLLDPRQMSWRDIRRVMKNHRTYETVYQQNDLIGDDALVQKVWIDGGRDEHGQIFLGCWDNDRDLWEAPTGLAGPQLGVISVDPSPTMFWSIQAWSLHEASKQDFLLDLHRAKMDAPEFLDWSPSMNRYTGILEDWRVNFEKAGVPLQWVIVEINAAQRFMLQYEHFQRWMRMTGVQIIGHSTQRNKTDPDYGVQMLAPLYRDGRVRLPGKARQGTNHWADGPSMLVSEVTRYPFAATNDCVMSQWFVSANREKLVSIIGNEPTGQPWRPTWLGGGSAA